MNQNKQNTTIPSLDEVKNFVKQNDLNVDYGKFYSYYNSRYWSKGKQLSKDWKELIKKWHKTQYTNAREKTTAFKEVIKDGEQIVYKEETDLEALCLSLFGKERGKTIWEEIKRREKNVRFKKD